MQLRTVAPLALLSSVAYSSQPLAFTATTTTTGSSRAHNNRFSSPPFSTRVRRRAVARRALILRAAPTEQEAQQSSEFTRRQQRPASASAQTRTPPAPLTSGGATPSSTRDGNAAIDSATTSTTLSMIVDSQKEFELNLGRAVDALKKDYPDLLTKDPQWHVYHTDLEVIDPSGVSLHGLDNYKMAFGFIHGVVKWFYCEEKSGLTSIRVGYDWARKCIRVSWNVELVPRMIYGGTRHTLHVDGISEYYLDRQSGLITEHRVSHLLINDVPVRPEKGIFSALAEMSPVDPEGVPVFFGAYKTGGEGGNDWPSVGRWEDMDLSRAEFRTWDSFPSLLGGRRTTTSLFSNPNESAMNLPDASMGAGDNPGVPYDRDALQRKNASRKKFGVPPLTPEEFVAIENEVRRMDAENKKKATYLAEQLAQSAAQSRKEREDGFLDKLFGGAFKNGCESNFDCERPEVCCDVGFKKICCSNGLGIVDGIPLEQWERAKLRVPMGNDNLDY